MAEQHGGKRTPRNPAPVSGPGAMSRRTDGGPQQVNAQMTGMGYGENADFMDIQSGAAMSVSPSARKAGAKGGKPQMQATPLFANTQRPDEPVTSGAPVGPGEGPMTMPDSRKQAQRDAAMIAKYLPDLMSIAESPDTPDGFKRFVRYVRNLQS